MPTESPVANNVDRFSRIVEYLLYEEHGDDDGERHGDDGDERGANVA